MAEQEEAVGAGDVGDGADSAYRAPAQKTVDELMNLDTEDDSLRKYKATLLGSSTNALPFPEDPRLVIVSKLALVVEGRPDMELDLTGDVESVKRQTFVLKEGCHYKVKIYFYVQREIVSGLKYVQKSYRKGIQVDDTKYMVGSYGPKMEAQSYSTPVDEAPSGVLSRGSYTVKSLFTDDDKTNHLQWKWTLDVKKDWQ